MVLSVDAAVILSFLIRKPGRRKNSFIRSVPKKDVMI